MAKRTSAIWIHQELWTERNGHLLCGEPRPNSKGHRAEEQGRSISELNCNCETFPLSLTYQHGKMRRKQEINKKQSIWWLGRAADPINTKAVDRPVRHTANNLQYSMPMTRTILLTTSLNPNTRIS